MDLPSPQLFPSAHLAEALERCFGVADITKLESGMIARAAQTTGAKVDPLHQMSFNRRFWIGDSVALT